MNTRSIQTEDKKVRKAVVLLGSPRKKGNSTVLARNIAKGAESAGVIVETLFIHGMDIKPCQACWSCQKEGSKGCVIEDDMHSVYPKLIEADAWIISSPIHWFSVSTQTKLWLDRSFALMAHGLESFDKKIAIALAYGDVDPFKSGCVNAIRTFQDAFSYAGATITGFVYGTALNVGDIEQNTELLNAAEALGKQLGKAVDG
ncbi:MAG: flavodoxin family protein [Deltaproteobacteria bacterium]|nr:flavodoxin family protein [Deltaproteobacteria bacterium]